MNFKTSIATLLSAIALFVPQSAIALTSLPQPRLLDPTALFSPSDGEIYIEYRKVKILASLAVAFAEIGELERALEVARAVPEQWLEGLFGGPMFHEIATHATRAGQAERIVELTQTLPDEYRTVVRYAVAETLAEAGESDRALEFARSLPDEHAHRASSDIAIVLAQKKQFDRALEVARTLRDNSNKARALGYIARALIEVGQFAPVLEIARSLADDTQNTDELYGIVRALIQIEQRDREALEGRHRALEVARIFPDESSKVEALSRVAIAFIESEQWERALEVARNLSDETDNSIALSRIATSFAKAGQWELALEFARVISDDSRANSALRTIAVALAEAEQIERALELLRGISDESDKTEAIGEIAVALVKAGQIERALELLQDISDESDKAEAISEVAVALVEAGQMERALEQVRSLQVDLDKVVVRARENASLEIDPIEGDLYDFPQAEALSQIAVALAEAGQIERALEVVRSLQARSDRVMALYERADDALPEAAPLGRAFYDQIPAEALSKIAAVLAEAGQLESALEVVRSLQVYTDRVMALHERARALGKAGESDRASEIRARIPDDNRLQAEALSEVAVAIAEAGQLERALEVPRIVGDLDWLSEQRILSDVAVALAEAGQLKSAFEVARKIESDMDLAPTLSDLYEIAVTLTEAGRFDPILETVGALPDDEYGRNAASGIVVALAKAELFDRALEAARTPSNRALVWARMARGLAKKGEAGRALENARRALELAPSLLDDERAALFGALALVFAEAGERHRALEILEQALVLVEYQPLPSARP